MKRIAVFLVVFVALVGTLSAQQESKSCYQDDIDVYIGSTFEYEPNYKFDRAKDMNNCKFITVGVRYKSFDEGVSLQFDHSFGLSTCNKFSSKYLLGGSLDFRIFHLEKSYLSLGVRYQEMMASFEDKENGVYDKYSIKSVRSVGPILRYKNRAWNLEIGYLFGANKAQWQNIDNTATLARERANSFYIKGSINISPLR